MSAVIACLLLATPIDVDYSGRRPRLLANPAGDIQVFSERKETLVDFFRRQRLTVAGVSEENLARLLKARAPQSEVMVSHPRSNDAPGNMPFGASLTIAPIPARLVPVVEGMVAKHRTRVLILRLDVQQGVYHVVGCMARNPSRFFTSAKIVAPDEFSEADLQYQP